MRISKWKPISEWKPASLSLPQVLEFMARNVRYLPDDIRGKTIVVIERMKPVTSRNLFRNQVKYQTVEEAVYFDKVPLGTANYSLSLEQNPHFKPFAEAVLQKIARMVLDSENHPVVIDDRFIYLIEPTPSGFMWLFKGDTYLMDSLSDNRKYSIEEMQLLILEYYDRDRQKWERLKRKYRSDTIEDVSYQRERIPESVRIEVWRRDGGKCARCGSREKLEYDHIVPVSKGGSNTARNIELLCESCNRKKSNNIQ
jgi:hypothetical protein